MTTVPKGPRHQARKRFGQHFLHDRNVIARIVDAIAPKAGDALIEIGPGLGALTRPLLERAGSLEAIELDRDVIPHLTATCAEVGTLVVHSGDVLEMDIRALAAGRRLRICGNLPYNISTPLLFHLLEARDVIQDMTFMLQKEVVLRMAAQPDTGDYGRLTVMLAAYGESTRLFDVGPGAFKPPPKVDSSIVRVVPHAQAPFAVPDPVRFAGIVSAAFGQRRKTLRNSLSQWVNADGFAACAIDSQRRAETLSPAEFAALARTPPPIPTSP
jgi:16S rRNA (adenine1518-N6/adenine1519-N6)-dimethyltransferase